MARDWLTPPRLIDDWCLHSPAYGTVVLSKPWCFTVAGRRRTKQCLVRTFWYAFTRNCGFLVSPAGRPEMTSSRQDSNDYFIFTHDTRLRIGHAKVYIISAMYTHPTAYRMKCTRFYGKYEIIYQKKQMRLLQIRTQDRLRKPSQLWLQHTTPTGSVYRFTPPSPVHTFTIDDWCFLSFFICFAKWPHSTDRLTHIHCSFYPPSIRIHHEVDHVPCSTHRFHSVELAFCHVFEWPTFTGQSSSILAVWKQPFPTKRTIQASSIKIDLLSHSSSPSFWHVQPIQPFCHGSAMDKLTRTTTQEPQPTTMTTTSSERQQHFRWMKMTQHNPIHAHAIPAI